MANSEITKKAMAESLKALLKEKSLEKISVKDIVDECGITRNSFYYHFKDKHELVYWIFYSDMKRQVGTFQNPDQLVDGFVKVCTFLYEEREFYQACFQYVGQNSLIDVLSKSYYEMWRKNLQARCARQRIRISEVELDLMAKMNSYALVGMISDWMKTGINKNYKVYFEQLRMLLNMEYFGGPRLHNRAVSEHVRLDARG